MRRVPASRFGAYPNEYRACPYPNAQVAGLRAAHLRDGAALVSWLAWLDAAVARGQPGLDECSISDELEASRARRAEYVSLSFPTIAAVDANAAIIHYTATRGAAAPVTASSMLLVDSGAQYRDGTTDVTRTVHLGTPTERQRRCFTRVLQVLLAKCIPRMRAPLDLCVPNARAGAHRARDGRVPGGH